MFENTCSICNNMRLDLVIDQMCQMCRSWIVMLHKMFEFLLTRIILIWTIILCLFSTIAIGEENLSYPDCGIIPTSTTIINGSTSSYPWMVFLYLATSAGESFCGGSLISDLQIVTAAHCVVGKTVDEVAVVLGTDNAKEELAKFHFRYLFKIDIYPMYEILDKTMDKTFKQSSDVAILTMEKPVVISSQVNPICLPSDAEVKKTYAGEEAIVAGWGVTETGQHSMKQQMQIKVPIISNDQCQTFYDWIARFYLKTNVLSIFLIKYDIFSFHLCTKE